MLAIRIHRAVRRIVAVALDLVVGARCGGCGARGVGTPCHACAVRLHEACAGAGVVAGAGAIDGGSTGRLVRLAKVGGWRGGGRVLAPLVLARVSDGERFDLVTWVPADTRRRALRGGHLPEDVAHVVAHELGVPARATLVRARARAQRGLDRRERAQNAQAAFRLGPVGRSGAPGLAGARVLLVDDVRTTGATFRACASLLEVAGASVHCVAVVGVERGGERRSGAGPVSPQGRQTAVEFPQRARYFHSRQGRPVPIPSFTSGERQNPGLTAPRPP